MPKIKVKKQMTLPELIEYIFEHDIKNKKFFGKTEKYARKNEIYVNEDAILIFHSHGTPLTSMKFSQSKLKKKSTRIQYCLNW